jgi:CubicO group peptidase (beta-lactamase class C family)
MNGSIQTVVDATGILHLDENGMIDLDADISEYIPFEISHPEFPDITITKRNSVKRRVVCPVCVCG